MGALQLRFPQHEIPDLVLSQGAHPVGLDRDGHPSLAEEAGAALVRFCVDRRGVWLQAAEEGCGLHVNGRPIRRVAMLRGGDSIYLEGLEMLLVGAEPAPAPDGEFPSRPNDRRTVLRAVGGFYHGHCFSLHERVTVGRSSDCTIILDDAALALRHAVLEPHPEGAVLRDLGTGNGSIVNGHRVRDALLRVGDQVLFSSQQRFVVEAPRGVGREPTALAEDAQPDSAEDAPDGAMPASVRRVPWLLLAALMLAGALSLLLLYGTR